MVPVAVVSQDLSIDASTLLFQTFSNHLAFETELPDDQEDMIKKLQTDAAAEFGVRTSDARCTTIEGRIGVVTSTNCGV